MNQTDLTQNFRNFTALSLDWCVREAEQGTTRVMSAIDVLLKDIARVSAMSADSLKALESLQSMLHSFDRSNYHQLQQSLGKLSRENSEIESYIQPIMEALQFRQNLENVLRMIDVWQAQRSRLEPGRAAADSLLDFGQALLQTTTMKRERDVIRTHIRGLPPESEAARIQMF